MFYLNTQGSQGQRPGDCATYWHGKSRHGISFVCKKTTGYRERGASGKHLREGTLPRGRNPKSPLSHSAIPLSKSSPKLPTPYTVMPRAMQLLLGKATTVSWSPWRSGPGGSLTELCLASGAVDCRLLSEQSLGLSYFQLLCVYRASLLTWGRWTGECVCSKSYVGQLQSCSFKTSCSQDGAQPMGGHDGHLIQDGVWNMN